MGTAGRWCAGALLGAKFQDRQGPGSRGWSGATCRAGLGWELRMADWGPQGSCFSQFREGTASWVVSSPSLGAYKQRWRDWSAAQSLGGSWTNKVAFHQVHWWSILESLGSFSILLFSSSLQSLTQGLGWGLRTPLPLQILSGLRVLIPGVWEPRPGTGLGPCFMQTGFQEGRSPSWCLEQLWLSHAVCIDISGSMFWELPLQECKVFPTCFLPGVALGSLCLGRGSDLQFK